MPSRRSAKHPLNPRTAVVYFSLHTEDYFIEDAAQEGDPDAKAILRDPYNLVIMEGEAVKNLSRMFEKRISNEGHDNSGDLVCKFGVDSWAEIKSALAAIEKNDSVSWASDSYPAVDVGVPFMFARDFRLYPDGVNDAFYGEERGAAGTWEEWLKANKPAASRRKNPPTGFRIAGPAVKTLVDGLRISKADAQRLKEMMDTGAPRILQAADRMMDGYGVERIPGRPGLMIVNMGDAYATTLIYDYKTNRFVVSSWGDIVERQPRRFED